MNPLLRLFKFLLSTTWLPLFFAAVLGQLPPAQAQTPVFDLAVRQGVHSAATGSQNSVVYASAADAQGNLYITGNFIGTVTFGSFTVSSPGGSVYVAKLDSRGNALWVNTASAGGLGSGIAVDASGNIYCTGIYLSSSITFGTITISNNGFDGGYVAKLDTNGNWLWARNIEFVDGSTAGGRLALDGAGNAYLSGSFYTSASFGGITLANTRSTADVYVAKIDAAGNWLWARSAGSLSVNDFSGGIAIDGNSNVYVAGTFQATASFGALSLSSAGGSDIFVAKLDATGNWQWVRSAGSPDDDGGFSIATDHSNNVYVTGYVSPAAAFGSLTPPSIGYIDAFVAKLDAAGNWLWARSGGSINSDAGSALTLDTNNNVYVAGYFSGPGTFGPTALTQKGGGDLFVSKLDAAGNWQWSCSAGSSSADNVGNLSVDAAGNTYVTGYFLGDTASFSSIKLVNSRRGRNMGFVARITTSPLANRHGEPLRAVQTVLFPSPAAAGAPTQLAVTGLPPHVQRIEVRLFDAAGRFIRSVGLRAQQGQSAGELPTQGLASGLYLVQPYALDAQGQATLPLPSRHFLVR
ncbi:SBBP repeat-containing protein [Hymenobacter sp. 15J16-1T3B]|uniref:SBBP repeat-containing protein n=1 Tax=Hymenobacter sp. 15J16-1T3B TaxID=2886941 RepID=UPI001D101500|nr:SBBP repeat-containing protein [Hymenobacter sp. 15J16-1T3B]MCC3158094.1 SBBP repeat-containing protein [Hymenobacter sp. 15J16-1T3B]